MQVKSTVKLNMARINELSQAAVRALEQTAEARIRKLCRRR